MANSWQKSWNDRKKILASGGGWMMMAHYSTFVGMAFLLLGVISDAINSTLGLEPTSWLLLAIFAMLFSIPSFIGWHSALHLDATEAKREKEQ
jgi:hypothetical protein